MDTQGAPDPKTPDWDLDIPARPLFALLDDAVAQFATRPFLNFFGRRSTYEEMAEEVARVAAGFQATGVGKGTKVALLLPNSPYFIIAFFAALKAGGIVVPCNPLLAEQELLRQIEDAEAEILVTADLTVLAGKLAAVLAQTRVRHVVICPFLDALPAIKRLPFRLFRRGELATAPTDPRCLAYRDVAADRADYVAPPLDPESDLAALLYTGGTSGTPKGVMLTHANLYANAIQIAHWFTRAERGNERLVAVLPLFHAFGLTAVLNFGVALGAELLLLPRFDMRELLRTIERRHATMLAGVPALFAAISREPHVERRDFSSLKVCVSGGDALPIPVKQAFEKRTGCALAEGYGLTECAPVVACSNPLEGLDKPGYVGLPLPRTKLEIVSLEDRRTVLPSGSVGEICVSGPQVMRGYLKQPAASDEALFEGRLHTGDVGRVDHEGFLMFVDRLKEVIVVRGYKVYPSQVEGAIRQHPAVAEAAVIGVPDPERGEVPWAYVTAVPGQNVTAAELLAFLSDKLSPMERPRRIELCATLPHSPIGKVLKRALPHPSVSRL